MLQGDPHGKRTDRPGARGMRSFFACVLKDVRLFFSRKAAVLVLLLPVLLLAVLVPGFGETTSARTYVRPFRFVICDQDDSVMSRSLINQQRQFELFEEIVSVREENEGGWFKKGYAAYATIPNGFFYAMYDMENLPVTVEFNPAMPAESSILETVFRSVTDIVAAEQQARLAEFRLREAKGMETDRDDLFYESANYELKRALSRNNVFSEYQLLEDYTENSAKAAFATVTAMLCMLLPLCVLRGVSEELALGIVDRLKCSGSGMLMLILSKYIAALVLTAVPYAVISAAVQPGATVLFCLSALMLFTLSFSLFGALSLSTPDPSRAQLTGNIIVILSLLFGGALYPYQMLPDMVQKAAVLSPVYHYLRGINGAASAFGVLFAAAVLFSCLFLYSCRHPLKTGGKMPAKRLPVRTEEAFSAPKTGKPDVLSITWHKLLAMTGSRRMLILMAAVCFLCFLTVNSILGEKSSREIVIAVADGDGTEISGEYFDKLSRAEGVKAVRADASQALRLLESGRVEALLYLDKGFEQAFLTDSELPLRFHTASASAASDAGREICAGILLSMQSSYDAISRLISADVISEKEKELFYEQLEAAEAEAKPIVIFKDKAGETYSEKAVFGRTTARYSGFSALIIFMFMLSLSVLLSGGPAHAVGKAMSAVRGGYRLHVLTDWLALTLAGLIMAIIALLCRSGGNMRDIAAYFFYVFCVSGICMLISLTRAGGGSDMTAAFFAMVTGTIGGCFFDLASLGRQYRTLSYFTPQGLLSGAVSGSSICLAAMVAVAILCLAVYYAAGKREK